MLTDFLQKKFLLLLCLHIGQYNTAQAAEHYIQPNNKDIQAVIDNARNGDTIIFTHGRHDGRLVINKSLVLQGEAGAIIDAEYKDDVIRVTAPDVVIRGLGIYNSGNNLTKMNAGIFVEATAENIMIEGNRFNGNTFGIWLANAKSPRVLNNTVRGRRETRSQDRGNGIHLSATSNAVIKGNEIWDTRDGVYIESSNNNTIEANIMHDLRYGIHYMYSHTNRVISNHTYNTRTGYALMQSTRLTVKDNTSKQDRNYGILLNFITYSEISNNKVENVRQGTGYVTGGDGILGAEGKAIFIYNSQYNHISSNFFSTCDIGIHLTAGSEGNQIHANTFSNNKTQVKYVSNRAQEWSRDGRGNFWSDYLGWDLNADGIGDKYYEPNDAVDRLLWKYPASRVLMNSPAVKTLRWVQQEFPVLKPQGVRDSAPLMRSPHTQDPQS